MKRAGEFEREERVERGQPCVRSHVPRLIIFVRTLDDLLRKFNVCGQFSLGALSFFQYCYTVEDLKYSASIRGPCQMRTSTDRSIR